MSTGVGRTSRLGPVRQALSQLTAELNNQGITDAERRALRRDAVAAKLELEQLLELLDPIRQPTSVFDPSDPRLVGRFVSLALVAQTRHPLSTIKTVKFYGSGVYAIYYTGAFPPYVPISKSETPIYVGRTSPAVKNARTAREQGIKLAQRLDEHRKNIEKATTTLAIDDFEYRALVVQSGWESAAEEYLINLFQPIWNTIVYGLGKHGDDAETRRNKRSPWDTMHPGRAWAAHESLEDAKSREDIERELDKHFADNPVFETLDSVLEGFVAELRQI